MSIETELQKATGKKPSSKEERMKYVERLVLASQDLSDTDWESLSSPAQKWVNENAKAYKAGKDLTDLPTGDDDDGDKKANGKAKDDDKPARSARGRKAAAKDEDDEKVKDDDEAKSKDDDEKPAKAARGRKSKEEDDEKPAAKKTGSGKSDDKEDDDKKPAKKASSGAVKGDGVKVRIKKMLLKDPDMKADVLFDKLREDGEAPSRMTVNGIRAEFRHTLRLLKEQGFTDGKGKEISI
jgi:hypothetical protein